jgi:cell division protein DivIC
MTKFYLRMTIYVLILIGIVGFVWLTCFNSWVEIYHNVSTKKALEDKYSELVDHEDELNDEVNKLQDPEYVAKYAREKYLYTKDGEIIIDVSNN